MNEKWETKRLMTWEQFEETFKPICESWDERAYGGVDIEYNGYKWHINNIMINEYFGKEIKVKKYTGFEDYTHSNGRGNAWNELWSGGNAWHELWFEPEFEPIEFIKEEEFMV